MFTCYTIELLDYPFIQFELNALPFTVIPPKYPAYYADTFIDPRINRLALNLSRPPEKAFYSACEALKSYDEETCTKYLRKSLEYDPNYQEAHLLLGILEAEKLNYEQTVSHLEQARVNPQKCGQILRRLLPSLRLLLRISRLYFFQIYPDYYGASLIEMSAFCKLRKLDDAQRIYSEIIKLFKPRDEMKVILAEGYIAEGRYEEALKYLSREEMRNLDELDSTMNILKGICELNLGKFHDAVLSLKNEINPTELKSEYLCGIARFLFSRALELDGLPLLALQESLKIDQKSIFNPTIRSFIRWREEKLKEKISEMSLEEIYKAGRLSWIKDDTQSDEEKKKIEEAMRRLLPEAWRAMNVEPVEERGQVASRTGSALLFPQTFRRSLGKGDEQGKVRGKEEGKVDEKKLEEASAEEASSQGSMASGGETPFEEGKIYQWSISTEGEREFLRFDFKGMRENPKALFGGEALLKKIEEYAYLVGLAIFVIIVLRGCG